MSIRVPAALCLCICVYLSVQMQGNKYIKTRVHMFSFPDIF